MIVQGVDFPEQPIAELCARYGVARLSLFGSILRDDFGPESDVDLLVQFVPGTRMGLFRFTELALEFERLIGRAVDLKEAEDLSPLFRGRVVKHARLLHAA